ncbi:MAG: penicillin-binding protein 2 [bacterium]|nr:penicillin-binding protein 2 [bacterium]
MRAHLERYQRQVGTGVLLCVAVAFLLLGGRLVQVNTVLGARLRQVAEQQHIGHTPVPARRGLIFDARGRVIAGSELVPSVFADPGLIEDLPSFAQRLAPALGMIAGEVEDVVRWSGAPRFCWLKRRIGADQERDVDGLALPGVGMVRESARRYPLGNSLAQVLGFVGAEGTGLAGVELHYDDHLRGRDGRLSSIRDVRRRAIWRRGGDTVAAVDGGHLMLAIDTVIQGIVEDELARSVAAFEAESGVAVVMSPGTGDVVAMACHPTFNPATYTDSSPECWRNRVVVDPVEPGSTIKAMIAGGALDAGVVTLTETIFCHQGEYTVGGRVLHDTKPHGNLTFEEIVAHSSNIGMAILGQRLGNPALHEIVGRFGFGCRTGIDFPGEGGGVVLPLRRWTKYSTTSIPMGYEIGVTPLQLATAYCAVVNGGVLLKPRLVRALLAADGTPVEVFEGPEPVRRVLPAEIARYLTERALVGVVRRDGNEASAYPMLGKTGTAKLTHPDRRGYAEGAYLSSFLGAAPVSDPQLVVLVMVRRPDPRIGYYGRAVALPVVRRILDSALTYLEVPCNPASAG